MGTSVHTHCLAAPGDEVRWSCLSGAEPSAQGNLCLADMPILIQTVFVKCFPGCWALRVKGKAPLGEPLMDGSPHRHFQFIDFEVDDALTQIIIFRHT